MPPHFNVLIVYEDFAAGKHAKETYDYLVHQLGRDYQFTNQMWKFDILGNFKMREMAVKDALEADLIIVSTHGIGELPAEVKTWLDQWLAQKGNAMALVTLVDRPQTEALESNSIRSYLQGLARKAKMDFFAQPDDWPDREEAFSTEQNSERAQKTSSIMAEIIHQHPTSARWGINE
ncbi:MAG: hypothetical protein JWR26_3778 [Pedosphaera sp.]|nr:hypothetical protein [Pedosphaera sp.]